jgi:hypothetical protein
MLRQYLQLPFGMVVQTERNSAVGAQRLLGPSALFSYAKLGPCIHLCIRKISSRPGRFGKFTALICKPPRLTGRDSSDAHRARQFRRAKYKPQQLLS